MAVNYMVDEIHGPYGAEIDLAMLTRPKMPTIIIIDKEVCGMEGGGERGLFFASTSDLGEYLLGRFTKSKLCSIDLENLLAEPNGDIAASNVRSK